MVSISNVFLLFYAIDNQLIQSMWPYVTIGLVFCCPFWIALFLVSINSGGVTRVLSAVFYMIFWPVGTTAFTFLTDNYQRVNIEESSFMLVGLPVLVMISSIPLLVGRFLFGQIIAHKKSTVHLLQPLSITALLSLFFVVPIFLSPLLYFYDELVDGSSRFAEQTLSYLIFGSAFTVPISLICSLTLIGILSERIRFVFIVQVLFVAFLLSAIVWPVSGNRFFQLQSEEILGLGIAFGSTYVWIAVFSIFLRLIGFRFCKINRNAESAIESDEIIDPLAIDDSDV